MAQNRNGQINYRFTNSRKAIADQGTDSGLNDPTKYPMNLNSLRGNLTTINAAYYTAAKLDQMTVNDMVFAIRNCLDATSIADYMVNQPA